MKSGGRLSSLTTEGKGGFDLTASSPKTGKGGGEWRQTRFDLNKCDSEIVFAGIVRYCHSACFLVRVEGPKSILELLKERSLTN